MEGMKERERGWQSFLFAECIDIKLEGEFSLYTIFTSLHIQRELFVI